MDAWLFMLGLALGAGTHEAGHQLTAWALGDQLAWRGRHWRCVEPCHDAWIAAGGFVLPAISSEVLLAKEERGPVASGWLAWNILEPIVYVVRHEAFGYGGDLAKFTSTQAPWVEAGLIAYSASVALRWAWKDKPEWFGLEPTGGGAKAMIVWRW